METIRHLTSVPEEEGDESEVDSLLAEIVSSANLIENTINRIADESGIPGLGERLAELQDRRNRRHRVNTEHQE